jgi:hypothetical protein
MPHRQQCRDEHDAGVIEDLKLETPIAKLAAKGVRVSDLISIGLAAGLSAVFFIVWAHAAAAEKYSVAMTSALTDQANAIRALTRAQILTTCVMAQPMPRRESEFSDSNSFCRRMADLP